MTWSGITDADAADTPQLSDPYVVVQTTSRNCIWWATAVSPHMTDDVARHRRSEPQQVLHMPRDPTLDSEPARLWKGP